jgi:PAS domain S-box-containing protein
LIDDEAVKKAARARFIASLCCLIVVGAAQRLAAQLPPASEAARASQSAPAPRTVLLLNESYGSAVLRAGFDAAFADAIHAATSGPFELYEENIETDRFPGAEQARVFVDYIAQKYGGRKIDVIVAQGFRALIFAREYRALFGNPPIVTSVAQPGQLDSNDRIIGLQGGSWAGDTIALARQLLPDTQHVYVIDGTIDNNGDIERQIRRQWRERHSSLTLNYLRDLTLADLVTRLATIPEHSIVLFLRQTIRTPSLSIEQSEVLTHILRASAAPVFSLRDDALGRGVLGGPIWRVDIDAKRVAEMAALLANGVSARDIPSGRNTYETRLDWQQLQRWRIPESRIPSGSVVLFRPKSFFDQYGGLVATGAAVFTAQLALIVGLLAQRARRRRAEEEARTHASRYRSVVDAQTELICRFLPDTTLTFVNDSYCRYWNTRREELLGHPFIEMIPEAARAGVMEGIRSLSQGSASREHPVCLPDGTEGWHLWVHHAIVDHHGRVIEYQGVGRDITDQKRAEIALRSAEARNTAILRAIPDLMFVLRRDGTYLDYHARDPSELYFPEDQFLGKTIREVMPPDLAEMMMDALERSCASGDPVVIEYELDIGELRYYEARIVPSANDQVLTIVRDVTDARRARELNRALAGRLIVSQEEERQRIARELHDDLSQKIAVLNIDIDRLSHQLQQSEHRARLRNISTQVAEIAEHVHDLSYELHPARLKTLGLLESLRVLCSEFTTQREVKVSFTGRESEIPLGLDHAISLCLYRIAQEALHNVARHSHADHASVRLFRDGGDICLQISDTGVGFEAHSSRQTGLGLVSMRERVAVLNGRLIVHTALGRGTRIVARIPLPVRRHPADSETPSREPHEAPATYSVSASVSAAGFTSTSTASTTDVITGPPDVIS